MEQPNESGVSFDLSLSEVDHSYLVQSRISFDSQAISKLVRKSYIFYVIELRTGVSPETLKNITAHIIQSCFQLIEQGLGGISFVINGTHHPLKSLNVPAVKELLSTVMVVSQNDDYFDTLQKARHAVQAVAQRLNETKVTLLFFLSYVDIDHSLGTKKRTYIDYLNQHSDNCREEVLKLSKTIRTFTDQCKCFIISLDKNGEEEEDYSLADTDLMNQISMHVGDYGSVIYRNYSNSQLSDSFRAVTALLLTELYSLSILIPTFPDQQHLKDERKYYLSCYNFREFNLTRNIFLHKTVLDVKRVMAGGAYVSDAKQLEEKLGEIECRAKASFKELEYDEMIVARTQLYNQQLGDISWKLSQEIVSYKRKYELGKSFLVMTINEPLLLTLRGRLDSIYQVSKELYSQIFQSKHANKHKLFEHYNQLKANVDAIQEVLLGVFKKRIGGSQIGKLSQLISLGSIKRALKVKLIRRINANPYLLDQVYRAIEDIVDGHTINFLDLQMNTQKIRSDLGNCILSDCNFARAMQNYDAMGVAFELQRPESAIADPGRIRIRQVSPYLMRTSQFFEKFIYKINYTPELVKVTLGRCLVCNRYNCYLIKHNLPTLRAIEDSQVLKYKQEKVKVEQIQWNKDVSSNSLDQPLTHKQRIVSDVTFQMREVDYLRDKGELHKTNYSQRCDYADRANRTPTVLGFMPLYLTKEHWLVAKQLMKPSLAWTATGEPLGYLFAQFQTIPFIVLANLIRTTREKQYELQQEERQAHECKDIKALNQLQTSINAMKQRLVRMKSILSAVEQTCKHILLELSTQKHDPKLLEAVAKQYRDYAQPINRTVDVISNNSAFIGQLYTAFNNELLPRPSEQQFHEFFIRLVEEELRRETDGWNEEETQDLFIDKLLNVESREISNWNFSVVGGEEYLEKFMMTLQGERVERNFVQLQKQELEMMLKKEGKFNDSQRLLLIEYKRLYQNRVLWLWYVRFLLFGVVERVKIHKWKCLTLNNSYMLFTLIIQNKKQRKNYKRREAVLANDYADPFDYAQAREYLEGQFIELRAKRESQVLKNHNLQVCVRAAEIFCVSGNLEEAAGTLLNFNQNGLMSYFDELMRGKCTRLSDKLRMLLTGEHRGVQLFAGWRMGKKKTNRLRQRYPVEFIRYQYKF